MCVRLSWFKFIFRNFGCIIIQESRCDHYLFKTNNSLNCSNGWKGCLGMLLPEGGVVSIPSLKASATWQQALLAGHMPREETGPHVCLCSDTGVVLLVLPHGLGHHWRWEVTHRSCQLSSSVLSFRIHHLCPVPLHSFLVRWELSFPATEEKTKLMSN